VEESSRPPHIELDVLIRFEDRRVVRLHGREKLVKSGLRLKRSIDAVTLRGGRVELDLTRVPLVVDLAEDQLQELPKRLWLWEPLVPGNVVVATAEGEQ
jgi:hypothetical protein